MATQTAYPHVGTEPQVTQPAGPAPTQLPNQGHFQTKAEDKSRAMADKIIGAAGKIGYAADASVQKVVDGKNFVKDKVTSVKETVHAKGQDMLEAAGAHKDKLVEGVKNFGHKIDPRQPISDLTEYLKTGVDRVKGFFKEKISEPLTFGFDDKDEKGQTLDKSGPRHRADTPGPAGFLHSMVGNITGTIHSMTPSPIRGAMVAAQEYGAGVWGYMKDAMGKAREAMREWANEAGGFFENLRERGREELGRNGKDEPGLDTPEGGKPGKAGKAGKTDPNAEKTGEDKLDLNKIPRFSADEMFKYNEEHFGKDLGEKVDKAYKDGNFNLPDRVMDVINPEGIAGNITKNYSQQMEKARDILLDKRTTRENIHDQLNQAGVEPGMFSKVTDSYRNAMRGIAAGGLAMSMLVGPINQATQAFGLEGPFPDIAPATTQIEGMLSRIDSLEAGLNDPVKVTKNKERTAGFGDTKSPKSLDQSYDLPARRMSPQRQTDLDQPKPDRHTSHGTSHQAFTGPRKQLTPKPGGTAQISPGGPASISPTAPTTPEVDRHPSTAKSHSIMQLPGGGPAAPKKSAEEKYPTQNMTHSERARYLEKHGRTRHPDRVAKMDEVDLTKAHENEGRTHSGPAQASMY